MQDSISGLVGCTSSRTGRDLVWKFLQENWTSLVTRFGEKSNFLIAFVEVKDAIIIDNVYVIMVCCLLVWSIRFCG